MWPYSFWKIKNFSIVLRMWIMYEPLLPIKLSSYAIITVTTSLVDSSSHFSKFLLFYRCCWNVHSRNRISANTFEFTAKTIRWTNISAKHKDEVLSPCLMNATMTSYHQGSKYPQIKKIFFCKVNSSWAPKSAFS